MRREWAGSSNGTPRVGWELNRHAAGGLGAQPARRAAKLRRGNSARGRIALRAGPNPGRGLALDRSHRRKPRGCARTMVRLPPPAPRRARPEALVAVVVGRRPAGRAAGPPVERAAVVAVQHARPVEPCVVWCVLCVVCGVLVCCGCGVWRAVVCGGCGGWRVEGGDAGGGGGGGGGVWWWRRWRRRCLWWWCWRWWWWWRW